MVLVVELIIWVIAIVYAVVTFYRLNKYIQNLEFLRRYMNSEKSFCLN